LGGCTKTIKCRLSKKCTNNQAEQFAILSALEYLEKIKTKDKRATIYTDRQTTLDKLQNSNIHSHIVEEIRRKLMELKIRECNITLCWVKAHAGIRGNELVDTLAKKAATNKTIPESYNKIPKSVVIKDLEDESANKWQRNWTKTLKGKTAKEYVPDVAERLKMKLRLTQNLTALVSGHGKTRDYLYRFKIIDEPTFP
jgi:ribonuclease HI